MLGSHRSQVDLLPHTAVEGKQCSVHGRRGIGPRQATNFLTVAVRQSIGNSRSFTYYTFTVRTEKDSEECWKTSADSLFVSIYQNGSITVGTGALRGSLLFKPANSVGGYLGALGALGIGCNSARFDHCFRCPALTNCAATAINQPGIDAIATPESE